MTTEAEAFQQSIFGTIDHLVDAVSPLSGEDLNWRPAVPNANSLCVITTHVLGNTEEAIRGAVCGADIPRNRAAEFAVAAEKPGELRTRWLDLKRRIVDALARLPAGDLDRVRSHHRRGTATGRELLILVTRHAAEHWGEAQLTLSLLKADYGERQGANPAIAKS